MGLRPTSEDLLSEMKRPFTHATPGVSRSRGGLARGRAPPVLHETKDKAHLFNGVLLFLILGGYFKE